MKQQVNNRNWRNTFRCVNDLYGRSFFNITFDNQKMNYRVIFDNEKYIFLSEEGNETFPSFSFRREHDEWLEQELLPADIKNQAINALEKYLLKQH